MKFSAAGSNQIVLVCTVLLVSARTTAFSPTLQTKLLSLEPTRISTNPNTALFLAKKVKNKARASSGSGFGAPNTAAAPKKLRSVSGQHGGVGSKVLRKATNTFDAIRKEHGAPESIHDVYIRSPLNNSTLFWFVGKVAVDPSAATPQAACLSQKRLILEYAKTHLRPQNLGGKYSSQLELWLAPGDSEMDVVQNKVDLKPVIGSAADLPADFNVDAVGFSPEIYVGDEIAQGGLRVQRDEQGRPIKPVFKVNQSL